MSTVDPGLASGTVCATLVYLTLTRLVNSQQRTRLVSHKADTLPGA